MRENFYENSGIFPADYFSTGSDSRRGSSSWKGRVEAGGVSSSGNTEFTNFNTALAVGYEKSEWLHEARAEYYLTKSEDDQTEWTVVSGSANYKISERYYAMAAIKYDENPDTGYDYRASESVGVGAYLFTRPTFTMKVEAGPGARQSGIKDGEKIDETIARGFLKLLWKISENYSLMQSGLVISGEEGVNTESVSEIESVIAGGMSLKITLRVVDDSDPPPDIEKTDTRLTVGIVYRFGEQK